jgi:hypothetical protein
MLMLHVEIWLFGGAGRGLLISRLGGKFFMNRLIYELTRIDNALA